MVKKKHFLAVIFIIVLGIMGCFESGGGGSNDDGASLQDHGVPNGVDLSADCPANGTWVTNTEKRAWITPPSKSVGELTINNWLVEIHTIRWEKTNICTTINYGGSWETCDYNPIFTGEVIRGYINPNETYLDSNENVLYHGVTTEGQELRFWDYTVPERVYLNIDFNKNGEFSQYDLIPF